MNNFDLTYHIGRKQTRVTYWFSADSSTPCFSLYRRRYAAHPTLAEDWEFIADESARGQEATDKAKHYLEKVLSNTLEAV